MEIKFRFGSFGNTVEKKEKEGFLTKSGYSNQY